MSEAKNLAVKKKKPQKTAVQKTFQKLFIYVLVFVGLMGLTFWAIFKDQNLGEVFNILHNANGFFVVLGLLLMVGYFAVEAWNIRSLLTGFGEKISFR